MVCVKVISPYRAHSRSASYTKAQWNAVVRPILEEYGLVEVKHDTSISISVWEGHMNEETVIKFRNRISLLQAKEHSAHRRFYITVRLDTEYTRNAENYRRRRLAEELIGELRKQGIPQEEMQRILNSQTF